MTSPNALRRVEARRGLSYPVWEVTPRTATSVLAGGAVSPRGPQARLSTQAEKAGLPGCVLGRARAGAHTQCSFSPWQDSRIPHASKPGPSPQTVGYGLDLTVLWKTLPVFSRASTTKDRKAKPAAGRDARRPDGRDSQQQTQRPGHLPSPSRGGGSSAGNSPMPTCGTRRVSEKPGETGHHCLSPTLLLNLCPCERNKNIS